MVLGWAGGHEPDLFSAQGQDQLLQDRPRGLILPLQVLKLLLQDLSLLLRSLQMGATNFTIPQL